MNIPEGSSIVVGQLKQRMEAKLARSIGVLTASFPEIEEAYLFGCFVTGMKAPAEVLTLVFSASCDPSNTTAKLGPNLSALLPPGTTLDLWPLTSAHSLVGSVRLNGRRLFKRSALGEAIFDDLTDEKKKWWQIW